MSEPLRLRREMGPNRSRYPWGVLLCACLAVEFILLVLTPVLGLIVDPFLLLLIFLSFQLPSGRFLWLFGSLVGFLKDVMTGALFGGFLCSFALLGWILGISRHFVEQEDALSQGIWVGFLTGVHGVLYGFLILLADPLVGWNRWFWVLLPFSMVTNGVIASVGFPQLRRQHA